MANAVLHIFVKGVMQRALYRFTTFLRKINGYSLGDIYDLCSAID